MAHTIYSKSDSNKKFFVISIIVSIIAISGFLIFIMRENPNKNVDPAVFKDVPDPSLVFDAPFTKTNLYYIELEKFAEDTSNPNAIGCGDAIIPYEISINKSFGSTKTDTLTYAISQLFDNKMFVQIQSENSSKMKKAYNAFASSSLAIKTIKENPGQYEIRFTGTLKMNGVCDAPRMEAQIQKTIDYILAPAQVAIFINDKPIKEALSGK